MTTEMSQACETPLLELLERVPADARAWYEHDATSHSHIPYGKHCQDAAALIRQQAAEIERMEDEAKSLRNAVLMQTASRDELYAALDITARQEIAELTAEVRRLNELEHVRYCEANDMTDEIVELQAEVARLTAELARLKEPPICAETDPEDHA